MNIQRPMDWTRRWALRLATTVAVLALAAMAAPSGASAAAFAKYDGIDGESKDANHESWTDILNIDWGVSRPTVGTSGQSRRRGAAVVEDMTITFEYDKSAPKILEKCLKGEVIPKLEIELTSTYGGARATYLRYELRNVSCTRYSVTGPTGDRNSDSTAGEGPPVVVVSNNFEEIKVTYTEYDDEGKSKGNVETEWKVEKGE